MLDPWGNLSGRHSLYDSPHNTHTFGVLIWDRRTSGVERSCAPYSGLSVSFRHSQSWGGGWGLRKGPEQDRLRGSVRGGR